MDSLQKDLSILAALSLSLSRVVGQNASLPMRLLKRLMGAPSLSAHVQTLSKPFLLCVFVVSHDGRYDAAFCMAANPMSAARLLFTPYNGFARCKKIVQRDEGPLYVGKCPFQPSDCAELGHSQAGDAARPIRTMASWPESTAIRIPV